MTIERSHGAARPTLPRASDLKEPEDTDRSPSVKRDAAGRFVSGNTEARAGRFKRTLRRVLGDDAGQGEAGIVAGDARRIFTHVLRSLPSDAPPVRALVALHARHLALHGFYTAKAEAAGLDTEAGLALLAVADRQSQRAERVLVTALDAARVCAAHAADARAMGDPLAAWRVAPAEPTSSPASSVTVVEADAAPSARVDPGDVTEARVHVRSDVTDKEGGRP